MNCLSNTKSMAVVEAPTQEIPDKAIETGRDLSSPRQRTSSFGRHSSTHKAVPEASNSLMAMDQFKDLCARNGFNDFTRAQNADDITILYVHVFWVPKNPGYIIWWPLTLLT